MSCEECVVVQLCRVVGEAFGTRQDLATRGVGAEGAAEVAFRLAAELRAAGRGDSLQEHLEAHFPAIEWATVHDYVDRYLKGEKERWQGT